MIGVLALTESGEAQPPRLGESQLFRYLAGCQRILVCGAGGGCDVYCALPIYLALKARGHHVHLGNLSFVELSKTDAERLDVSLYKVAASSRAPTDYFPESILSRWFVERGEEVPVYALARTGVAPLCDAYKTLVDHLKPDAIVLVDGGTDALMRGDEFHLATPEEDVASIIAVSETGVARQALACTAFGVDAYHGICHAHFLENMAYFMKTGGYLGVFSADPNMAESLAFVDAVKHLESAMPARASIVNSSVLSAIEGDYGDHHRIHRTAGSKLWINPLMSLYWAFKLEHVAKRILYTDQVRDTQTWTDMRAQIGGFRQSLTDRREFEDIPV